MSKLARGVMGAVIAVAGAIGVGLPAHAAILGPEAAACAPGANRPALLVSIDGFKARTGDLRVQLYGANPEDFLAKGKKMKRIELPVTPSGVMEVCVALPAPGDYAIAVRHDVDGSGKSNWNDGGGFSRNPRLSLLSLKPDYDKVVIRTENGVRRVPVTMQYRQGFSIGPVAMASR
ncbi:DUF2141 domain-containing protein [Sphingomonas montanisoli]|uniref:DUF2141 domain-containing protein n=1 Tax=Sphingomonas montanisoli TaxID=2606412 RepID=A0A5D9CCD0_9SPHN|nr:DUF2141 domain-containing protein [Sphingomonas montanisoli]TZG29329.1 DUF2141 domain-containing protein [Sphingomonas montanisoli]